ncbi:hypothetical protein CKO28_05955 [Rhodovibrio sodomensis]|uniref:Uncharacterized protein n=1 Tax=Rhodovibrio sodomensis TaxID=1088 RepID=A0ABS1DB35_9PROT|nr:hypothetical protein [Rhodovibrio sodomensis]
MKRRTISRPTGVRAGKLSAARMIELLAAGSSPVEADALVVADTRAIIRAAMANVSVSLLGHGVMFSLDFARSCLMPSGSRREPFA